MRLLLPLIFVGIPLIEIALFVAIGQEIGILATIAIVILTALAGTALLRHQGFAVLTQARQAIDEGRMPLGAVFDGLFLLVAGVLLLTPGFFTDALGFLLFVPRFRLFLGTKLMNLFVQMPQRRPNNSAGPTSSDGSRRRPPVIEGEIIEGEIIDSQDEPRNDTRK